MSQATRVRRPLRGAKAAREYLGGMSNSQFYAEITAGRIPPPAKLFADSRVGTWFTDELDAIVDEAIARRDADRTEAANQAAA
jgi:predicted DNA-binding transcriptional regulator AlpA